MREQERHIWDVWFPAAGATGLPFGRGRLDPTAVPWLHAAPETVTVTVYDEGGRLVTWWHAPDHAEWRWRLEFYNHI